jgi:hypothetical protein
MTPTEIREFASKLECFNSPDEVDLVLNRAASTIEELERMLSIGLKALREFSWEGSSVNYKARMTLNEMNLNPHYTWVNQVERMIELEAKCERMEKVVDASRNGPCRHDSSHNGSSCALCNALKQLDKLDAKDGEG